jgi:alkylation response protein AidB-like acyl-CoA dehydrogenase
VEDRHRALLQGTRQIAREVLAPRAEATDQAEGPPVENLRVLAEAGLLGLTTPQEYGGHGAPGEVIRAFMEILAGACGVTTFLLFQHLGACGQIARGENEKLKEELLPRLARGERFCTLAFSHLRRPGPPAVRVEVEADGYRFHGVAPWATGWDVADELLLAGTLPDGNSVWVVAPAIESQALQPSPPMRLCAASASNTVSLTCNGLKVGRERRVKTLPREQLAEDTFTGLLGHSMLSLGVAFTAATLVRARGEARDLPALVAAAEALEREAAAARRDVEFWAERPAVPEYRRNVVRIRAWCIDVGARAAQAAVIAGGGAANSLDQPAQRLYREALLYSVTALTPDLQAAAMERLTGRPAILRAEEGSLAGQAPPLADGSHP